ncbi:MAG: hypothetical protein ACOYJ2_01255 [Rickettsiales bacterium]
MEFIIYFVIIVIVITDVYVAQKLMAKRKSLDLTNPEDVKKDKALRIAVPAVLFYSFVIAVGLIYFVKPLLVAG